MSKSDLLPPNATRLDRAVMQATALPDDMKVNIGDPARPYDCPPALLPWLAWAMSVDRWNPDWSEDVKRAVIAQSVLIHRRKGTIGSVRRALAAYGFGRAVIVEGQSAKIRNATFNRDGTETHGDPVEWAQYSVFLERPLSIAQGLELRAVLALVAPVRCHLDQLNFTEVAFSHNGQILRDGTYTHGAT